MLQVRASLFSSFLSFLPFALLFFSFELLWSFDVTAARRTRAQPRTIDSANHLSIPTDIYNHPSVVNPVIAGQLKSNFQTSHAQGPPYSRRRCLSDLLNYNYEEINDPGTSKLHPPCGICRESYLGMENSTHPNTTRVPLPTHRCAAHSSPATQRWMGVQQRCSGV